MFLQKRKDNGESEKAVKEATEHVREIEARGPEVNELVADLKRIRARNHFAEQLHAMLSHKGGVGT